MADRELSSDEDEQQEIQWARYPEVADQPRPRAWLTMQHNLGLAPNTVAAYGRALDDFLCFSRERDVAPEGASREHVAWYVRDLSTRPNRRSGRGRSRARLANATLQQYLTAVRLYFDYLVEDGLRSSNPVGRGRYTPGRHFANAGDRGILPRYRTLPWIPDDVQWRSILEAARLEPQRNRFMLALAYDAALRREELCRLETGDIDPSARLLRVRAETTKGRRERVVPFSASTATLYGAYLEERRSLARSRGPLFLSMSRRNRGQPITLWTWSKVVTGIARRADVPNFSTHTPRHLCLTDLARAGWGVHEIAQFAGHRNIQTTLLYIHVSGRELATKLERGLAAIHTWRAEMSAEVLR